MSFLAKIIDIDFLNLLASYLSILILNTVANNHKYNTLILMGMLKNPKQNLSKVCSLFYFPLHLLYIEFSDFNGDLTSLHQVSHSIFSCWAEALPWVREREALHRGDENTYIICGIKVDDKENKCAGKSVYEPGEDDHHGVDVNGAVCDSLQDKLFICTRKLLVEWTNWTYYTYQVIQGPNIWIWLIWFGYDDHYTSVSISVSKSVQIWFPPPRSLKKQSKSVQNDSTSSQNTHSLTHSPMIFLPCLISISSTMAPNCSMALMV